MVTLRITENSEQAKAFIELAKTFSFVMVESEGDDVYLTEEQKAILDERLKEDSEAYLTEKEFFDQLKERYGI